MKVFKVLCMRKTQVVFFNFLIIYAKWLPIFYYIFKENRFCLYISFQYFLCILKSLFVNLFLLLYFMFILASNSFLLWWSIWYQNYDIWAIKIWELTIVAGWWKRKKEWKKGGKENRGREEEKKKTPQHHYLKTGEQKKRSQDTKGQDTGKNQNALR